MASPEQVEREQERRRQDDDHYTMRISRQTVDKLGVKLYDRVSAVVAELVANAYDADAEDVHVRLPLATLLAADSAPEPGTENEYFVEVEDDGHGMTPAEADAHYLQVGRNRREHADQGSRSRHKERPVMGRKGIGKLAPFGICTRMEIISAGGDETAEGYITSHFILDYDEILQDTEQDYYPDRGDRDRTFSPESGTTVRLTHFQRKRVPGKDTFLRQLARRFGGELPEFRIVVEDTRRPDQNPPEVVGGVDIPIVEETKIELEGRPVELDDGTELPVSGWVAIAKKGYKHEELAGIRIYARNKIVAVTRDFEIMSGFTGEHTLRSYLVGEIHAEWLDEDDGEDLIKTDRQDILWDSDYGTAFRKWGADLLKEVGRLSRKPRRRSARDLFLEVSNFEERARESFGDEAIVQTAMELANRIGGFAAEDELEDEEYVDGLAEVILSVAPHQALIEALQDFSERVGEGDTGFEGLLDLFDKSRVAELASYSQIASERVRVVDRLEEVIDREEDERVLQDLIAGAPWLLEPSWTVITTDEGLRTFARRFKAFWKDRHGEDLDIAIDHQTKRPDFTAVQIGKKLRIVELKAPGHVFDDGDLLRLQNYVRAFRDFFEANGGFREEFPAGWQIDLIADDVNIRDASREEAYRSFENNEEVDRSTWEDFLLRARRANEQFLEARRKARAMAADIRELMEQAPAAAGE